MRIQFSFLIKEACETNRKTNGKICAFFFLVVTSGCGANNEVHYS